MFHTVLTPLDVPYSLDSTGCSIQSELNRIWKTIICCRRVLTSLDSGEGFGQSGHGEGDLCSPNSSGVTRRGAIVGNLHDVSSIRGIYGMRNHRDCQCSCLGKTLALARGPMLDSTIYVKQRIERMALLNKLNHYGNRGKSEKGVMYYSLHNVPMGGFWQGRSQQEAQMFSKVQDDFRDYSKLRDLEPYRLALTNARNKQPDQPGLLAIELRIERDECAKKVLFKQSCTKLGPGEEYKMCGDGMASQRLQKWSGEWLQVVPLLDPIW